MGLKKQPEMPVDITDAINAPKPKRTLIVDQMSDDTFCCCYSNIIARQQLLPMLRAAERQFRIKLNREALGLPANPPKEAQNEGTNLDRS